MRIEIRIPESDMKQIEKYQNIIKEIMESHLKGIDINTDTGAQESNKAIKRIKTDSSIILCEKMIQDIYANTIPQTILIAENEEDKKILNKLLHEV